MRVVFLIDGLAGIGGGISTYVESLLAALPAHGVEAVVLGGQPAEHQPAGLDYVHVPGLDADRAKLGATESRQLRRALAAAEPDITYSHVVLPEVTRIAAETTPVILYAHEYLTVCPGGSRYLERSRGFCAEGAGARCFWRAYTERTTNRRPDRLINAYARTMAWRTTWPSAARIFVASPFVADVLIAGGAPSERVRVVPYPVVAPPRVEATHSADVLYLGRLSPAKGVDVLLNALARLEGTTAVIAGEGPARGSLEALAQRLGISERVDFVGWVSPESRAQLLAGSRLLAVPSLWDEAFGIVGVEAFGAGVPVVASAVGGIPSWLTDGQAGLLFPRGDVAALADAIRSITTDEELAASFRDRAPIEAARFSLERHLGLLLPELRSLAG